MDSRPRATRNRVRLNSGREDGALERKIDRALAGSRDRVAGPGSKTGECFSHLAKTRPAHRQVDAEHREKV